MRLVLRGTKYALAWLLAPLWLWFGLGLWAWKYGDQSKWKTALLWLSCPLVLPLGSLFAGFMTMAMWFITIYTADGRADFWTSWVRAWKRRYGQKMWPSRVIITDEQRFLAHEIMVIAGGDDISKLTEEALAELPVKELRALRARIDRVLGTRGPEAIRWERQPSCLYLNVDGESTLVPFDI